MNPINIAKGLLNKWDEVKDTDAKLAGEIKQELTAMADDVREAVGELRGLVDPPTIELDDGTTVPTSTAADIRETGRRLDEVVSGKPSAKAAGGAGKQTTAAAKAPEQT